MTLLQDGSKSLIIKVKTTMKVSVVIPSYAPGEYLTECIESLEAQTLPKDMFEVLIVLNGPRDPYYDMIYNHLSKSKLSSNLIYTADKGISNARNIGLDKISSKYVAFIDDDDLISPEYLQALVEITDQQTIAISNFKTFKNEFKESTNDHLSDTYIKLKNHKQLTILNSRRFFSNVCGKMIPVSLIGTTKFDCKLKNGEDSVFIVEISKNISKIKLTADNAIYFRRLRQDSASRRKISSRDLFGVTIYEIGKYISMGIHKPQKYNILFLFFKILASLKSFANNLFSTLN